MVGPRHLSLGLAALLAAILAAGCGGGSDSGSDAESGEAFSPQATLKAVGGTQRTDKPELVMSVRTRPGDTNIRSVAVNLPPVLLVDTNALGGVCPESKLESDDCAGYQRVGFARAVSPAYDKPLSGPVFAVSGSGGLPRLAYDLSGPADLILYGRIVSKGGRMQAGVEEVPDTPLSSFELTIEGGKPGYLVLSEDICTEQAIADGTFTSQDDEVHREKIPLVAECGS